MPASLLLFLPLALQLGPALPRTDLPEPRKPRYEAPAPATPPPAATTRETDCLVLARSDPPAAIDFAESWQAEAQSMTERAAQQHCLGMAAAALDRWDDAEEAFLSARDSTPANERANRARLGTLAGNAALARGSADRALTTLDVAHSDALGGEDPRLAGEIAIDRARALVALGREADAASALAEARAGTPKNAQGWLLSATLSRRQGKLGEAQGQIEQAAELLPVDPEIGLEAGVIAVMSGRDQAARLSWLSVIKAAPGSPAAKTAQAYLDQLGPQAASPAR